MTVDEIAAQIQSLGSPERAAGAQRFFKTGPGQYGEGDLFVGVSVPTLRKLAKEHRSLPLDQIALLLPSPIHEVRSLALLLLAQIAAGNDEDLRKTVYDLYLTNTRYVNNWDLVDSSAPAVVGGYLLDRSHRPLLKLARSPSLWERRIAIVATQHFIRKGRFGATFEIAELLLGDREDLLHKATGWMLREVGDRDEAALMEFLESHRRIMPRTMLRYAIEKFAPDERKRLMGK